MKLYELSDEFKTALEKYDPEQDELGLLEDVINSLALAIEKKAEGIVKLLSNWESDVSAIDTEIGRLKAKKEQIEKRVSWMRNYLSNHLQHAGIDKMDLGTHNISFLKSSAVMVDDESKVPDKYKKEKIVITVDKKAIKDAYKTGIGIEGTHIEERKNIQIK